MSGGSGIIKYVVLSLLVLFSVPITFVTPTFPFPLLLTRYPEKGHKVVVVKLWDTFLSKIFIDILCLERVEVLPRKSCPILAYAHVDTPSLLHYYYYLCRLFSGLSESLHLGLDEFTLFLPQSSLSGFPVNHFTPSNYTRDYYENKRGRGRERKQTLFKWERFKSFPCPCWQSSENSNAPMSTHISLCEFYLATPL